jgi:hypothetical protein
MKKDNKGGGNNKKKVKIKNKKKDKYIHVPGRGGPQSCEMLKPPKVYIIYSQMVVRLLALRAGRAFTSNKIRYSFLLEAASIPGSYGGWKET